MFCAQLRKDFQTAALDERWHPKDNLLPSTLRLWMLDTIKALSSCESEGLRRLLNRVDISEKQMSRFHMQHKNMSFEEVVAELVVRRTLQKVIIRKKFSNE